MKERVEKLRKLMEENRLDGAIKIAIRTEG